MSTLLKKSREEKDLKQWQIAEKVGIPIVSYQRYESGKRIPDIHTAQRIAQALGEDVGTLFPLPER